MTRRMTRPDQIEYHRDFWKQVALQKGWYSFPFHVVVWVNECGDVVDSVSYRDLGEDIVLPA